MACGLAVALAAFGLLPAFVLRVRTGGWPALRRRVRRATSVTLATVVAGGGLVVWAQHLTAHQRNAGFGWYQLMFVVVGVLFSASVVAWTAAAIVATRRLNIELTTLKVVGILAVTVAMCMPIMTVAAASWWGSMATTAPWFLTGASVGSSPSPLAVNLLVVLITMTIASIAGISRGASDHPFVAAVAACQTVSALYEAKCLDHRRIRFTWPEHFHEVSVPTDLKRAGPVPIASSGYRTVDCRIRFHGV